MSKYGQNSVSGIDPKFSCTTTISALPTKQQVGSEIEEQQSRQGSSSRDRGLEDMRGWVEQLCRKPMRYFGFFHVDSKNSSLGISSSSLTTSQPRIRLAGDRSLFRPQFCALSLLRRLRSSLLWRCYPTGVYRGAMMVAWFSRKMWTAFPPQLRLGQSACSVTYS